MQATLSSFPIGDLQTALFLVMGGIIFVAASLQLGSVVKQILKRVRIK